MKNKMKIYPTHAGAIEGFENSQIVGQRNRSKMEIVTPDGIVYFRSVERPEGIKGYALYCVEFHEEVNDIEYKEIVDMAKSQLVFGDVSED